MPVRCVLVDALRHDTLSREEPSLSAQGVKNNKLQTKLCEEHTEYIYTLRMRNVELLGAFAILRKAKITFVMSVHPCVRMEKLCSHWTEFHEI